jgi:homoserine O-acetyltransferase
MRLLAFLFLVLLGAPAMAQTDYSARLTEGDIVLRDFRFRSGETMAELRIHYATLGTPHRDARGGSTMR